MSALERIQLRRRLYVDFELVLRRPIETARVTGNLQTSGYRSGLGLDRRPEPRFWIVSGLPIIHSEQLNWSCYAFDSALQFSQALQSREVEMKVRRVANASCLLLSLTVFSVSSARAGQSAQAADQQSLAAIRAACAEDAQKLCAGVQPGGGRIVACLKEHKDSLSDGCRKAAGLATNPSGSGSAPSAPRTSPTSESQAAGAATSPAAKPSPAAGTGSKAPSQTGAAPTSYLRMKQVQVIAHVADPALGGKVDLPAIDLLIPSTWDFKGSVAANTKEGCFSDIHAVSWEATSSDGSLAFQGAPNDSWQYSDDPAALRKLTDPNRRALGAQGKPCPVMKPMKAEDYFRQEILTAFPSGSTVVSVEPFPELNQIARKQLGLPPGDGSNESSARTEAIRARVKFQKDGKDLEDWVTLVVVTRIFRQGQGSFYDCHAIYVT